MFLRRPPDTREVLAPAHTQEQTTTLIEIATMVVHSEDGSCPMTIKAHLPKFDTQGKRGNQAPKEGRKGSE